jgi:hypothetical protein
MPHTSATLPKPKRMTTAKPMAMIAKVAIMACFRLAQPLLVCGCSDLAILFSSVRKKGVPNPHSHGSEPHKL